MGRRYFNLAYGSEDQADQNADALGLWTPARQGVAAWTMDPITTSTGAGANVGTVYLQPFVPPGDATINTIYCAVTAGATTPTANQCFMGIYDKIGLLLAQTADISALLTSTGLKSVALTSPLDIRAGGFYYAAFLQNAAAAASLRCGYNSTVINVGSAGRFLKTTLTNLTALPNPIGTLTDSGNPYFMAVS